MSDNPENKTANKREKAWLVVNTQLYSLDRSVTTIGRSLESEIVIQDEHVSRKHAQIRYENDDYVLYDLDSTGGTYLNNKKIKRSVLHAGNIITLTNVPMVFVGEEHTLKVRAEGDTSTLKSP